jgi:hypothetical protein
MRHTLALLGVVGLAMSASADLIITEVVDGDLSGGNPKWVEICNTGGSDVTFTGDDFLRVYFNGGGSASVNVSLDGITITSNTAIVVASTSNGGQAAFENTYGVAATLYTGSSFGNGDDTYSLEGLSGVIDTYGPIGVDGTGTAWEYTDSFAYRNFNITASNPTFAESEWTFGGVGALDGPDDSTRTALLLANTTPFSHVPAPGVVGLAGLAGMVAFRRRRA